MPRPFCQHSPRPLRRPLAALPPPMPQVCSEIIDASGVVAWEDIAGLQTAKDLVKEIVVWPMLNPHIFTVRRANRVKQSNLKGAEPSGSAPKPAMA